MIGRWNVIDPLAENHHSTDPYSYVLNNPMSYIDPLGLDTIKVDDNKTKIRPVVDSFVADDGTVIQSALPEATIVGQGHGTSSGTTQQNNILSNINQNKK